MVSNPTECLFRPNPGQQEFLSCPSRFRLALTGVGGGKSAVGAIEAMCLTKENGATPGMIISPTYDMLRLNTVPPIKEWWPRGLIKNPGTLNTKTGPFQIEAWNGATIYFRSASDPDQLRGPNLGWAWLDEAGMMDRYAWDVILGRLRVPCPRPGAILTTTPKGFTWLHDVFYENPPSTDYAMVQWAAQENKGNLAEGYYEELIRSLPPAMVEQEVYGKFVNVNAEAFLNYRSVMSCERDRLPYLPQDDVPLYIGVDIGRKHDMTVITALWKHGDTYWTGLVKKLKGAPFSIQRECIDSLAPRAAMICIDETGIGAQLSEELQYEYGGLVQGIVFGPKSKGEMAARMRKMFENGRLRIPRDSKFRSSLLSVETQYTQAGTVSLTASRNEDGHADEFWSLALACHAVGIEPSDTLLAFV